MNLRYQGGFRDVDNNKYVVNIYVNKSVSSVEELTLADDAVHINYEQDSSDVFSPIKCSGCTIKVLTKDILTDLYTGQILDTQIKIYRQDYNNSTNNWGSQYLYWMGFNSPNIYNQEYYSDADNMSIECIDCLSALKYFKYEKQGDGKEFLTMPFRTIFINCLKKVMSNPSVVLLNGGSNWLNQYYISEENFFDEGDENMNMREVLEHISKFLGLVLMQFRDKFYLVKKEIIKGNITGHQYVEQGSQSITEVITTYDGEVAENNCSVSYGDVFNNVNVICNTNPIDELFEKDQSFTDDTNMSQFGDMQTINDGDYTYFIKKYNSTIATQKKYETQPSTRELIWTATPANDDSSFEEQTKFYKYTTKPYTDSTDLTNYSNSGYYWNITRTASYRTSEQHPDPEWDTYMTFKVLDTSGERVEIAKRYSLYKPWEKPLFQYQTNRSIAIGKETIYIVLSGKVKLSNTEYEKQDVSTDNTGISKESGDGYEVMDYTLKIGNKYWNGTEWTTNVSRAKFLVGLDDLKTETWYDITNTVDYTLELGQRGLMIPINPSDKLSGPIEFTLYPMKQYDSFNTYTSYYDDTGVNRTGHFNEDGVLNPTEDSFTTEEIFNNQSIIDDKVVHWTQDEDNNWIDVVAHNEFGMNNKLRAKYILVKDLKFNFISLVGDFFDDAANEGVDLIYTNEIDKNIVSKMDDITLYVNTYNPTYHTALSSSFVSDGNDNYVETIDGKRPEDAIVEKYVNHYSTPKLIYQNTIVNKNIRPFDNVKVLNKTMSIGNADYDLKYNTIDITLNEL